MQENKFPQEDFIYAQNLVGSLIQFDFGYSPYPTRILIVTECRKEDVQLTPITKVQAFHFKTFDVTRNVNNDSNAMRLTIDEIRELINKKELSYFKLLTK